jgi:hypothetical protein
MELLRGHDALVKFVFGEPAQFRELLALCLPPAVFAAMDSGTLKRLDGELVDDALAKGQLDIAFEVQIDGTWVLLHLVEHKSWADPLTALQVAGYTLRLLERWRRQHPERRLPAVLPLVVHHGDRPWRVPQSLRELIDLGPSPAGALASWLQPFQLQQQFLLLDLAAMPRQQIEAAQCSAATVLTLLFLQYLRHCPPVHIAAATAPWRELLEALRGEQRGREVMVALVSWLFGNAPVDHEQVRIIMSKAEADSLPVRSMLDEIEAIYEARGMERGFERGMERGIERGIERGMERGMERGIERGLQAGYRRLFQALLQQRFGPLAATMDARIEEADAPTIERWSQHLLTATAIDDVFVDA